MLRKLPVYILADVSGSMSGDKISAVNQGLKDLKTELVADAGACDSAFISVISFDNDARQIAPLVEVQAFQPPMLSANGTTNLGAALRILGAAMKSEVRFVASAESKGDWKPLVFLYTDGAPTDSDYPAEIANLKKQYSFNMVALAVGADADTTVLKTLTNNVMQCADSTTEIKKFVQFMTQSIKTVSVSTQTAGAAPVAMPAPPPSFVINP